MERGPSDAPGRIVDGLGRAGLVGYGVLHLLVGWLALRIAFGAPDAPADAGGAVGTVAMSPGGALLLVLGVLAMLTFVVWQLTAASIGFRWVHGGERFRKRVGAVSKSIAIVGLCVVIASFLLGNRQEGDAAAQGLASTVLALPAGRVLLGLGAVVLLGIAGAMTYTGVRRTFLGDLDLSRTPRAVRVAIEVIGAAGHLARALALAVVGVLAAVAAFVGDPGRAGGLDDALRVIAGTPAGAVGLVAVALGIAAFGLFCFGDAATRKA